MGKEFQNSSTYFENKEGSPHQESHKNIHIVTGITELQQH